MVSEYGPVMLGVALAGYSVIENSDVTDDSKMLLKFIVISISIVIAYLTKNELKTSKKKIRNLLEYVVGAGVAFTIGKICLWVRSID